MNEYWSWQFVIRLVDQSQKGVHCFESYSFVRFQHLESGAGVKDVGKECRTEIQAENMNASWLLEQRKAPWNQILLCHGINNRFSDGIAQLCAVLGADFLQESDVESLCNWAIFLLFEDVDGSIQDAEVHLVGVGVRQVMHSLRDARQHWKQSQ